VINDYSTVLHYIIFGLEKKNSLEWKLCMTANKGADLGGMGSGRNLTII